MILFTLIDRNRPFSQLDSYVYVHSLNIGKMWTGAFFYSAFYYVFRNRAVSIPPVFLPGPNWRWSAHLNAHHRDGHIYPNNKLSRTTSVTPMTGSLQKRAWRGAAPAALEHRTRAIVPNGETRPAPRTPVVICRAVSTTHGYTRVAPARTFAPPHLPSLPPLCPHSLCALLLFFCFCFFSMHGWICQECGPTPSPLVEECFFFFFTGD